MELQADYIKQEENKNTVQGKTASAPFQFDKRCTLVPLNLFC